MRRERRGRKRINEWIRMDDWEKYFRDLLGGVDNRVEKGIKGRRENGKGELERREM